MKLANLLFDTDIPYPERLGEIEITGISYDSRKIEGGNIFVCLKGRNTDGHIFAGDAALRGAGAIITERDLDISFTPVLKVEDSRKALAKIASNYYGNPSTDMILYGITGTNGKTTVSYLVKSGLEAWGTDCGMIGTISYKVGDKEYEAERTTPESLDIQKIFKELKCQNISCCVMEVSSHALELGRVRNLKFDYSIFTNLSLDHMDFHKDEEEYYQSKKKLFKQTCKMGIINIDDEAGRRLAGELKNEGMKLATFSIKRSDGDYKGIVKSLDEKGVSMSLQYKDREIMEIESSLGGGFSMYNILAAAACLHVGGVSTEAIAKGIYDVKVVPGRFELVKNSKNIIAFVDFAHTPDALKKVLLTAGDLTKGRIICVFGCGGDRDKTKRPFMGKIAGSHSDYCILTSDNPRTESQEEIFAQIEEGLYESGCIYEVIEDRREAIKRAIKIYKKGDIIIIAGKGHENYQIIGGAKKYFSDRETIIELIEKTE